MIKAVLVDDEISNLENLRTLLENYCPQVNIVATAQRVSDALLVIESCLPDLVFLDIQIGEQTGFDVLKSLPTRKFEVIFVTAYDQYGIQAVKFAALDYLLKPIDIEELRSAVNKAEHKLAAQIRSEEHTSELQSREK